MEKDPDDTYIPDKKSTKREQYIVGTILYCARSFDPTMIQVINGIYPVS